MNVNSNNTVLAASSPITAPGIEPDYNHCRNS